MNKGFAHIFIRIGIVDISPPSPLPLPPPPSSQLLDYNCKGGKMTRAKTITRIVDLKEDGETPPAKKAKLSKEEDPMYAAAVLGWCLEIVCLPVPGPSSGTVSN